MNKFKIESFNQVEEALATIKVISVRKRAIKFFSFLVKVSRVTKIKNREEREEEIVYTVERFVNYCLSKVKEADDKGKSPQYQSNLVGNIYKSVTTLATPREMSDIEISSNKGTWKQGREHLGVPKKHANHIYRDAGEGAWKYVERLVEPE